MALRNRSTIPQGMLAPSGLEPTVVNPNAQMTTRPFGTLLPPSPGYDSVRAGKNIFQRGVPSGGFRPMTFAEDVGGTGAAISITPGDTTAEEVTEWLPESPDSLPNGAMVISDRVAEPGFASNLHEGYNTIPDMGDRTAARPLSRGLAGLRNPVALIRKDWAEDPAITLLGCSMIVILIAMIENDLKRAYRSNRGRGLASSATAVPAAGAETAGNVTAEAMDDIGKAADTAIEKIEQATDTAVSAIKDAGNTVTGGGGGGE